MPGLEADGSLGSSPQQAADVGTQRRRAPFPVLGIMHAHRHARFLYQRAGREAVSIADAASAWEFDADSEDTFDTIDGLLDYGLIEESGIGNMRKIRLTELGWRMADDPDEEEFRRVVCEVAGKPKLIADYAARWREDRPEDKVCIAQLQAEQGFTDELAADFLSCLQESLFHMRFGSPSGQARQRLPPTVAGPPPFNQRNVLLQGDRLQIAADLDLDGVDHLRETLSRYEKILRLASPRTVRSRGRGRKPVSRV